MIRIYGYYSCGGYKDMYLGNNEGEPQPTYFLPLFVDNHADFPHILI